MNTTIMLNILQEELSGCLADSWQLTGCEIQHPRYKRYLNPKSFGKSFLALAYHLRGIDKKSKKSADRIFYVKAYLGEGSLNEYERVCADSHIDRESLPIHIEKYGMVVWTFPNDPVLTWLPKIFATNEMRGYFSDVLLANHTEESCRVQDLAAEIINYRPEIRCTFRYNLKLNVGKTQTVYGKTFADGRGEEIYHRSVILNRHTNNNPNSFVVADPLAYDPILHTLWMAEVTGYAFIDNLNEHNAEKLMIRLAQCLVDFHSLNLEGLETITEADQLTEIQKKSLKLQSAFPSLAHRINTIVDGLSQQNTQLPVMTNRLIHGDFHIQQLLLLQDGRIALFDFDELALANPLTDLANFAADLYTLKLGEKFTDSLICHLLNAYQALSAIAFSPDHFAWHLKLQLLTRAYRAYIQQKPDLVPLIQQLLTAAESGLLYKNKDYANV